jgi:hypothetical protein
MAGPPISGGILERSWDTGDSPLSKCGVEPVLPLLLPLALIISCIAFSHWIVSIGIAQLVVCWFCKLYITGSHPVEDFYCFRLEHLEVPLFRFVPFYMQLATLAFWLLAEFTPIGKNFTLPLPVDLPSESPSWLHILPHEASKIPIQKWTPRPHTFLQKPGFRYFVCVYTYCMYSIR